MDAMGGDHAPDEVVKGAVEAAEEGLCGRVLLVGRGDVVREALGKAAVGDVAEVIEASQEVGMDESPIKALKEKPRSSVVMAVRLVRAGRAQVAISAGNTGAFVAASLFLLRPLVGVKRPGIAVPFPSENEAGTCIIIDAGANLKTKPVHLLQYALMASEYYRAAFGVDRPRVGLLNVGTEAGKGTEPLHDAYKLLSSAGGEINFIGNVEGQGLFAGDCEVAVCDGFVGNAILKVAEGMGEGMLRWLGRALEKYSGDAGVREFVLEELNRLGNYASYGGAPLLGVDGVSVICHGRSRADAVRNAVGVGVDLHRKGVNRRIVDGLARMGFGWWRPSRWVEFFKRGREDES